MQVSFLLVLAFASPTAWAASWFASLFVKSEGRAGAVFPIVASSSSSRSLSSTSSSTKPVGQKAPMLGDEQAQVVLTPEQSVEGVVKVVTEDEYLGMPEHVSGGYFFDGAVEIEDENSKAGACGEGVEMQGGQKTHHMLFNFTSNDPRVLDTDGLEGLLSVGAGEEVVPIPCKYDLTAKSWQYVQKRGSSKYGFVPLAYLYPPYERVDLSTIKKPRNEPSPSGIPYAALPPSQKRSAKPARCSAMYLPHYPPPMDEAPKVLKVKHATGIGGWVSVGSPEEAMLRVSRTVEFVYLRQDKLQTLTVSIDKVVWPKPEGRTRGFLPARGFSDAMRIRNPSLQASTVLDYTHSAGGSGAKYPKHRSCKISSSDSSSLPGSSESSGYSSLEGDSGSDGSASSRDGGTTCSGPRSYYSTSDRSSLLASTSSQSFRRSTSTVSSTYSAPAMQARREHKQAECGLKSYSCRRQSARVAGVQEDEFRALARETCKALPLCIKPEMHVDTARSPPSRSSKLASQSVEGDRHSGGVSSLRKALPTDKHGIKKPHAQSTKGHASEPPRYESANPRVARRSSLVGAAKMAPLRLWVSSEDNGRSEVPIKRVAWNASDRS